MPRAQTFGLGLCQTTVCGDDRADIFRAPTAAVIRANFVVRPEDGVDRRPGGFHFTPNHQFDLSTSENACSNRYSRRGNP